MECKHAHEHGGCNPLSELVTSMGTTQFYVGLDLGDSTGHFMVGLDKSGKYFLRIVENGDWRASDDRAQFHKAGSWTSS